MKKILGVFAVILILVFAIAYAWHENDVFSVFSPNTSPEKAIAAIDSSENEDDLIQGEWGIECDVAGYNRYTWKSTLSLNNADVSIRVSFTDLEVRNDPLPAFIIYSENPDYYLEWLYVRSDGSFDPEFTYFDISDLMNDYPGGYFAFEEELEKLGIDWVTSYSKVRAEFLLLYLGKEHPCQPKQQIDSESA